VYCLTWKFMTSLTSLVLDSLEHNEPECDRNTEVALTGQYLLYMNRIRPETAITVNGFDSSRMCVPPKSQGRQLLPVSASAPTTICTHSHSPSFLRNYGLYMHFIDLMYVVHYKTKVHSSTYLRVLGIIAFFDRTYNKFF
jgi:hypothetical protein